MYLATKLGEDHTLPTRTHAEKGGKHSDKDSFIHGLITNRMQNTEFDAFTEALCTSRGGLQFFAKIKQTNFDKRTYVWQIHD